MCCIIYYVYLRIRDYARKPKPADNNKVVMGNRVADEVMYNAQQLEDYVRKKERTYWTNY